jgi:hypothetical protein
MGYESLGSEIMLHPNPAETQKNAILPDFCFYGNGRRPGREIKKNP